MFLFLCSKRLYATRSSHEIFIHQHAIFPQSEIGCELRYARKLEDDSRIESPPLVQDGDDGNRRTTTHIRPAYHRGENHSYGLKSAHK